MNAYRIHNDIVASRDEQEAIRTWAEYYERPAIQAGPVEQVDPETLEIQLQDEPDGEFRTGRLAEVMPAEGPQIVCFGECECCGGGE